MIEQIGEDIARLKNRLETCPQSAYPAELEGRYRPSRKTREDRAQALVASNP